MFLRPSCRTLPGLARLVRTTFGAALFVVMAALLLRGASADDPESATRPADAKEDLLMVAMRERAKGIEVYIRDGQERVAAQAVTEPLMRFNDIPRRFRDATLWYWKHRGRPVALLKTQVREKAPLTRWLDELNSLTDDLDGKVDGKGVRNLIRG